MDEPLISATGINHVALRVSDLAASRDFYERLVGASVYKETESACFLQLGENDFIALFANDSAYIEHFCCTMDAYDADELAARLEAEGFSIHRVADRIFVRDPDGLLVQLSAEEFE